VVAVECWIEWSVRLFGGKLIYVSSVTSWIYLGIKSVFVVELGMGFWSRKVLGAGLGFVYTCFICNKGVLGCILISIKVKLFLYINNLNFS
jgi:hypothetical protein